MMRRNDSESEEGELSDQEVVPPPQKPVKKNAGALWAEVVESQNLEDEFKASGVTEDGGNYVDRGAESFHIPEEAVFGNPPEQSHQINEEGDVDLFDVASVSERFGVKRDVLSPNSRKRRMESPESSSRASSSSSRPNSRGSFKMNNKAKKKKVLALPFMSNGFSYDQMFESEIPGDLDEKEVGKRIAKVFGELDDASVCFAVKTIGVPLALELYNEALKIEKEGGMAVENGARRRTPGGVFFKLIKDSDKVEKQLKAKINENSRKIMEKMRNEKQKQKERNLKPLPKATDLLKPEVTAPSVSGPAPTFDLKSEIKNLMDFA
ncbi:unnamed protein product [Bursaphelenchus xylophilus]|uniref:Phosphorylated adapter RNA export protein n=1 Tax=Bursaphelenchus xylophilus TaxID=6326 RepID=A0A1I7RRS6_BURXY|nr:unnamed protein product [Bursaphelenchus xylophilus]CAG9123504.1 unnamed protein product [Bursaphelenchus xylophilus]